MTSSRTNQGALNMLLSYCSTSTVWQYVEREDISTWRGWWRQKSETLSDLAFSPYVMCSVDWNRVRRKNTLKFKFSKQRLEYINFPPNRFCSKPYHMIAIMPWVSSSDMGTSLSAAEVMLMLLSSWDSWLPLSRQLPLNGEREWWHVHSWQEDSLLPLWTHLSTLLDSYYRASSKICLKT